jgi:hypothetical protein
MKLAAAKDHGPMVYAKIILKLHCARWQEKEIQWIGFVRRSIRHRNLNTPVILADGIEKMSRILI